MSDTATDPSTPVEAPPEDAPVEDAPAPDAPVADPAAPEVSPDAGEARTPRTDLESDIMVVCNAYVTGELVLEDGKTLTPHVIANQIHANRGKVGSVPSSGAVSAALNRWAEIGFITLHPKPMAFEDYTEAGRNEGLKALKDAHRARRSAAKAAAKAADAPAPTAPAEAPLAAPAAAEVVETVAVEGDVVVDTAHEVPEPTF